MWSTRLRSRTAFSKACSSLTNGWEHDHVIPITVQEQILGGFIRFYDRRHWKYPIIERATSVRFERTTAGWTFVVVAGDAEITVSKRCKPVDMLSDILEACRGAVHYDQILPFKARSDTEVDHCNAGGFRGIVEEWMRGEDIAKIYCAVVHNDPRVAHHVKRGYKTFKEPLLTEWRQFHKASAVLKELDPDEHKRVTKRRRCA